MIKKWEKYKEFLATGAWHIHTNYTDGESTVFEYCKKAEELKLPLIAFTEHVRKEMNYNFLDLKEKVEQVRKKFDFKIVLGCEAKVLDKKGNLDVSQKILEESEIVLGAFHGIVFQNKEDFLGALKNMIKNSYIDVWAHPGLFYLRQDFHLTEKEIDEITKLCKKNKVLMEINLKYNLPEEKVLNSAKKNKVKFIYGLDTHSAKELELLKSRRFYAKEK